MQLDNNQIQPNELKSIYDVDVAHTPPKKILHTMNAAIDKPSTFNELRPILAQYSERLIVVSDKKDDYHLNTNRIMKNGKNLFFGAVQIKKNYVSYHLMPVYVNPRLLDSISVQLRERMQGKSCFNFTSLDAGLFKELASLTKSGYRFYDDEGYIR